VGRVSVLEVRLYYNTVVENVSLITTNRNFDYIHNSRVKFAGKERRKSKSRCVFGGVVRIYLMKCK
jgi:hypothetical protein